MNSGVYLHYKGGRYWVLGIAANSSDDGNDDEYVVYISLDATKPGPRMRMRRLSEFIGYVAINGVQVPRYDFVGDL